MSIQKKKTIHLVWDIGGADLFFTKHFKSKKIFPTTYNRDNI